VCVCVCVGGGVKSKISWLATALLKHRIIRISRWLDTGLKEFCCTWKTSSLLKIMISLYVYHWKWKGHFSAVPCTLFLLIWTGLHLLFPSPGVWLVSCSILTPYLFYSIQPWRRGQHAPLKHWCPPINLYSVIIKKPIMWNPDILTPYGQLTHCGRVKQICVFNTVKLGTSASSP